MKDIIIVGNWKSNKTVNDAISWMNSFAPLLTQSLNAKVVVCAPYTQLFTLKEKIRELSMPIELGAQSISPYPDGAYTGQISAHMLAELVTWVIIGHSERRKYFHETEEDLFSQTKNAKEKGLKVIYCVSDDLMKIPPDADMVGYEPTWAIGTGKVDSPDNANAVISKIKALSNISKAVYGGSVNAENAALFTAQPQIDGVLIGGASLDPEKFFSLIGNAAKI